MVTAALSGSTGMSAPAQAGGGAARHGTAPANARMIGQVLFADGDFDALRRRDDVRQSV